MRLKRFESISQLRAAVEGRLNRQLSSADWQAIAPDWSPPYDSSDAREVASRASDLPALRDERARNLAADVARLKDQIIDYAPRRLEGSPIYTGAVSVGELYRHIAARSARAETADSRVYLSSLYWSIGRLFHEALAVDWLAKEHGLMMGTAVELLAASFDPDEAAKFPTIRPHHSYAKMVLARLPAAGPRFLRACEEGRREGLAVAKGKLTDTDRVLLVARSTLAYAGWAESWQGYESLRLACLAEPAVFSDGLRSFNGWRAFRVAVKRAERRAKEAEAA